MKRLPLMILLLVLAGFFLGLAHLLHLRFEFGDVFPEYSSLRADPLGTKALLESLALLRPARRHFESPAKLPPGKQTTLFHLGAKPEELRFTETEFRAVEAFVRDGGRLVLAMSPVQRPGTRGTRFVPARPGPRPRSRKADPSDGDRPDPADTLSITQRWGLSFAYAPLRKTKAGVYGSEPAFLEARESLPRLLSVHAGLYFDDVSPEWRVVYARTNSRPVMMERSLGGGTLVLCADAFPVSNEAMLLEREPALLAWLAGDSQQFLVDEYHLGVRSSPGVATLLRKYRLHGFLAALLLLTGLFLWRNAAPFLPSIRSATGNAEPVTGRESAAGFANLLRRNLPASGLMATLLEQWKAGCGATQRPAPEQLHKLQVLIDAEQAQPAWRQHPVSLYNQIAELLSRPTRRHRTLSDSR